MENPPQLAFGNEDEEMTVGVEAAWLAPQPLGGWISDDSKEEEEDPSEVEGISGLEDPSVPL